MALTWVEACARAVEVAEIAYAVDLDLATPSAERTAGRGGRAGDRHETR